MSINLSYYFIFRANHLIMSHGEFFLTPYIYRKKVYFPAD